MKEVSKERKFVESVDISIGLKDVNLKDPSKRFRAEIVLPHKPNKAARIAVVGTTDILERVKELNVQQMLSDTDVENIAKDPKAAKGFVKDIDYVLAIPQMMAIVGKNLGRFLGPVGKTPSVLPPNAEFESFLDRYQRICKLRLRQNPVIHARVATRDMENNDIAENVEVVLRELEKRLDNGPHNIKHVHIKTTMGPAVEIGGTN